MFIGAGEAEGAEKMVAFDEYLAKASAEEVDKAGMLLVEKASVIDEILLTLLQDPTFAKIFNELRDGIIPRKYPDLLSLKEEAVLRFYTTNPGYKGLNQALRGEIPMTDFYNIKNNLMNQALDKLPVSSYNASSTLYRIENLTDAQIASTYQEDAIITSKSFISTTYSEKALEEAMKRRPYTLLLRITGKDGKLIEELSTLPTENEILFNSGRQFLVTKIGQSADASQGYQEFVKTVWLTEQ